MLGDLWGAAAADTTDEALIRFIYAQAVATRNDTILARLAKNPALPADLGRELDNSNFAKVLVARMSRAEFGKDQLIQAAGDKRVTVRIELAQTSGLPAEVYAKLLTGVMSEKVVGAILSNTTIPLETRIEAIRLYAEKNESSSRVWRRATRDTQQRVLALLESYPEAVPGVLKTANPTSDLTGALLRLTGVDEDSLRTVISACLQALAATTGPDTTSRYRTWGKFYELIEILSSAAAYTDYPEDLWKETIKTVSAFGGTKDVVTQLNAVKARAQKRPPVPHADSKMRAGDLDAVIAQSITLENRIRAGLDYELTDEQFIRLLCENSNTWQFQPSQLSKSGVEKANELLAKLAGRDECIGVLCARLLPEQINEELIQGVNYGRCARAVYELTPPEGWAEGSLGNHAFKREWWMPRVLEDGITDEVAAGLPAWLANTSRVQARVWNEEGAEGLRGRWIGAVTGWLFTHLGEDLGAWSVFDKTGVGMPGSLLDAVLVVKETIAETAQ